MAGPKLEIFKFGLYLSLPIAVMVHFGKPEWYTKNVLPYRDRLFPKNENITRTVPMDKSSVHDALMDFKAQSRAKRLSKNSVKRSDEA